MFNQLSSLTSSYFEWQLLNRFPSDEFGKKKEKEMETPLGHGEAPILRCFSHFVLPKPQGHTVLLCKSEKREEKNPGNVVAVTAKDDTTSTSGNLEVGFDALIG
uniref:Ovule protein n=1 Tax=Heterorhabditis bacteriophora TaxID=37862 RepID=A0A1I7WXU3_HETBA